MSFNGELLNYSTFMPWKRKRTMTEWIMLSEKSQPQKIIY
jgi:hypothetical protein